MLWKTNPIECPAGARLKANMKYKIGALGWQLWAWRGSGPKESDRPQSQ